MSRALVALQFLLIVLLIVRAHPAAIAAPSLVALVAGVALGAWALWVNRPGNFNIRPEPKAGGRLVTSGPYRLVRHPMYLSVLLFTAAFALAGDGWQWPAWLALAAVLYAKALREERGLPLVHPDYPDYRARTRAILPFLL